MKRVAFHNLGCKVNSYELDIMRQILRERGYEEVSFREQADIYVVNTCTVTNIADRKSRQMLHRAKKQNPSAVVIAVGCYVETDPERVEKDDAIDLVIGNNRKAQIGEILEACLAAREKEPGNSAADACGAASPGAGVGAGGKTAFAEAAFTKPAFTEPALAESAIAEPAFAKSVIAKPAFTKPALAEPGFAKPAFMQDLTCSPEYEDMQLTSPGHTRAYIKIQDGCNQFCSYCIIPFARGRIRSRSPEEILREVRGLAAGGIREIVLTGIHVSSYGLDRDAGARKRAGSDPDKRAGFDPDRAGEALLDLLRALHGVEGIERIRMSSLEPRIMTEPFISGLSKLKKVCPHFHLSLQSGCDATLRRMNRHYTTAEYAESVALLRRYYDRPAITTDVIVGFPGETDEEFAQTCAFLEKIRFYEIHVFRYSKRQGTAAARMPDQIPEPLKALRSDRLLALTAAQADEYRMQFAGERETLLPEEVCEYGGKKYLVGSTARYVTGAILLDELPDAGEAAAGPGPGIMAEGRFTEESIPLSRGSALRFSVTGTGRARIFTEIRR